MTIHDAIIIGSGAAGTWAAMGLKDRKPLMLDVGFEPTMKYQEKYPHLFDLKENPEMAFPLLIGENYQSLSNIFNDYVSPKFKAPAMEFVIKKPKEAQTLTQNFSSFESFSKGGLANAWGAGCYRYQSDELKDFPFLPQDLDPYYDELTKKIGISGKNDDLTRFYGTTKDLLPAIEISSSLREIFEKYEKNKSSFHSKGLYWGYPRIAYKNYVSKALDYYLPHNPSIYTPAFTLDELSSQGFVDYRSGYWVESYLEKENRVEVKAKNLKTGDTEFFYSKSLVVALGAINSSSFVLRSMKEINKKLPILDNNISYVPFVAPQLIGKMASKEVSFGSPMTMVLNDSNTKYQISFYNIGGVLLSDLLGNFPLSAKAQLICSKYLLPSMFIGQVFYPDKVNNKNYLTITSDGSTKIVYGEETNRVIENKLIKLMRPLGLLSHKSLIQKPTAGNSIHYAGMLPMKKHPTKPCECDSNGKLYVSKRVFISDSAGFPYLPAKNHTFTIMANALRIANHIHKDFLSQ